MINVHASLLPRYRGAAPIHRAIIAGETRTGRHHHARRRSARRRSDARRRCTGDRPGRDQPDRTRAGPRRRRPSSIVDRLSIGSVDDASRSRSRDLRPSPDARSTNRLARRRPRDSQPGARLATVAACVHAFPRRARFIIRRSRPLGRAARSRRSGTVDDDGDQLIVAAGEGFVQLLDIQPEDDVSDRPGIPAGHASAAESVFGPT